MARVNRAWNELRRVGIIKDFSGNAPGSVLIECGNTRVICTAMIDSNVPPFLKGTGKGWLTAEYAMLPSSTPVRKQRDISRNDSRSVEIQRLIGRSLRSAVRLDRLGENCIHVDCDVIQADGGTRTASITGAFVALCLATDRWLDSGTINSSPIIRQVAAVSAGIVENSCLLDLNYEEDSTAYADLNLAMADSDFIEVQVTGEKRPIKREELNVLLNLSETGIQRLMKLQRETLGNIFERVFNK